jgi:hypothetical protein
LGQIIRSNAARCHHFDLLAKSANQFSQPFPTLAGRGLTATGHHTRYTTIDKQLHVVDRVGT